MRARIPTLTSQLHRMFVTSSAPGRFVTDKKAPTTTFHFHDIPVDNQFHQFNAGLIRYARPSTPTSRHTSGFPRSPGCDRIAPDNFSHGQALSNPQPGAVAPVPVDLVTYYTEAGMDYRPWSRNFNMHFGFYRWGMNPLALARMLEEMSRQVFRRLALGEGMKVLDLGCGLGAPARALIQQNVVAAMAVTKVEWQIAMA